MKCYVDMEITGDREKAQEAKVFPRVFNCYWFESFLRRPEMISLLETQVDGTFTAVNALERFRNH